MASRARRAAEPLIGRWRVAAGAGLAVWGLLGGGPGTAAGVPQPQRPQMPTLPLTQLDERVAASDLDRRTLSLAFPQPVPLAELLLALVRDTTLSIVADPAAGGSFVGDLKAVTVRQALDIVLPPLGLAYEVDGSVVRVFRRRVETRLFDVDYVAALRTGSSSVGGGQREGSFARVATTVAPNVLTDIADGIRTLLSEEATYHLDRSAGLLQVTDLPERLDRVAAYLEAVQDRVHRQVRIEARILEVELQDDKAGSLDWSRLARETSGTTDRGSPGALRVRDVPRLLAALASQGTVTTLASPQLLVLNNSVAVVHATRTTGSPESDLPPDEEVTLAVTPQIAGNGMVMLSVSPIVRVRDEPPRDRGRATVGAVGETDTLARVGDGETLVVAGLLRSREVRERRRPGLDGWFGRPTVVVRKRVELVILLTPTVLTTPGVE